MTFGSLFSGIGGFDLGFERAGMTCAWQVEIDPFCRQVLAKHWPEVRRHDDVRTFPTEGDWSCDVICGGFPCQDVSALNYKGKGLKGERSGLWTEMLRIIRVLRPSIAVIENVPALAFRGLDSVLYDLAKSGLDAEWQTVPASLFGAPHDRSRIFILAYPNSKRFETDAILGSEPPCPKGEEQAERLRRWPGVGKPSNALPLRSRWCPDSSLCRMVDEFPDRLDRYRGLGNAVVPVVAEWIGRRLMMAAGEVNK